jgi:hypothetical protein
VPLTLIVPLLARLPVTVTPPEKLEVLLPFCVNDPLIVVGPVMLSVPLLVTPLDIVCDVPLSVTVAPELRVNPAMVSAPLLVKVYPLGKVGVPSVDEPPELIVSEPPLRLKPEGLNVPPLYTVMLPAFCVILPV